MENAEKVGLRPTIGAREIPKGCRVRLRRNALQPPGEPGWEADTMETNAGKWSVMCRVYGFEDEIGSVYGHDIVEAKINGEWRAVVHTKAQLTCQKRVAAFGF